MNFNKIIIKTKLISLISVITTFVGGGLLLPILLTTNNTNNNTNIQQSIMNEQQQSTEPQIVNSVDDIVVSDANMNNYTGSAILKINGVQELYVWGRNTEGQLGVGDKVNKEFPTKIKDLTIPCGAVIRTFYVGLYSSFVWYTAKENGEDEDHIYVWGWNRYGQLGITKQDEWFDSPHQFDVKRFKGKIQKFVYRKAFDYSAYAIIDKGDGSFETYVWGYNTHYTLGLGHYLNVYTPTVLQFPDAMKDWTIIDIDMGGDSYKSYGYALFEKDGVVQPWVWGSIIDNRKYTPIEYDLQLFDIDKDHPGKIVEFKLSYEGDGYAIIKRNNGINELYVMNYKSPKKVKLDFSPQEIFINAGTMFAIKNVGDIKNIYAWGANGYGQCGVDMLDRNIGVPTLIKPEFYENGTIEKFYTQSSIWSLNSSENGSSFLTVRDKNNKQQVYAWGRNDYGQLGLGDKENKIKPTPMTLPKEIEDAELLFTAHENIWYHGYSGWMTFFEIASARDKKSRYYVIGNNQNNQLGLGSDQIDVTQLTEILPIWDTRPGKTSGDDKLSATDAYISFYADYAVLSEEKRKILGGYVGLSSFPAGANLTIIKDATKIDFGNGTLDFQLNTDKCYVPLVTKPNPWPLTFDIPIKGFRSVTAYAKIPITPKIEKLKEDAVKLNEIFNKIVVEEDGKNKVIDFWTLNDYFALSSIPLTSTINIDWFKDEAKNQLVFTMDTDKIYGIYGQTTETPTTVRFVIDLPLVNPIPPVDPINPVDPANPVISGSSNVCLILWICIGLLLLLIIIIICYLVYRSKRNAKDLDNLDSSN